MQRRDKEVFFFCLDWEKKIIVHVLAFLLLVCFFVYLLLCLFFFVLDSRSSRAMRAVEI